MSASFQAVPQPYPLYAAVVMVRKHPDEPWDHNAWTALVIGWHHYRDPDGSVVALLGANGAGKTSLLRVASGLLPPALGEIRVDSGDYTGRPSHTSGRV